MPSKQYRNRRQLEEVKRQLDYSSIVEIKGDSMLQKLFHKMLRRDGESIRVSKDSGKGTLILKKK